MSDIKIFVSVGRIATKQQEAFVGAIESHMKAHGLNPLALNRTFFSSEEPLKAIEELMGQCSGVAILAFERLYLSRAIELRGSDLESQLADVALPSVWNQIEAAMAYMRGLPLLVLIQQDLRSEGLLEHKYDWYVKRLPVGAQAVDDREFCEVFDHWRRRVERHHVKSLPAETATAQMGSSPTVQARAEAPRGVNRRQLRLVLENRFSSDELATLCFDLNVDYENVPGSTKVAKAIAIIMLFERLQRAQELMNCVRELRPNEL